MSLYLKINIALQHMETSSMFDTLLELPLLRGVSRERITELAGKSKLHFLKYNPGDIILRMSDESTHLRFVLSGDARVHIHGRTGRFMLSYTLTGPAIIMPDYLFGLATQSPCNVVATTAVSVLQIEKSEYMKILAMDPVFMLNYLNYLSMNSQKGLCGVLAMSGGDIESRVAFWIVSLTQLSSKDIILSSMSDELHNIFGVEQSKLFKSLERMKKLGMLDYTPDRIVVKNRRKLLDLLFDKNK